MTNGHTLQITHSDAVFFQKSHQWWGIGAIFGIIGGFSLMMIGLFLTFICCVFKQQFMFNSIHIFTDILFYLAFPTLFFGGYCLDKIDEIAQKSKKGDSK